MRGGGARQPLGKNSVNQGPASDGSDLAEVHFQYRYRTNVTQYLPHKLAEYIGNNLQNELGIKKEGPKWTVAELNDILHENLVPDRMGNHIHTCEKVEWEHEDYEGRPMARSSPFKKTRGTYIKVFTCTAWEFPGASRRGG